MIISANSPFIAGALNTFLLFLQNSSSQSGSGGNVDLNPATVGIPVIAYLIGAAIFLGAVFLLYRRAVNKKKDILSK